jgi:phenylacetate-coenzyme A ligase PaaK-like adenylate-forming protein
VHGKWKYQSIVYSDQLIRVRVDVEDTAENQNAMRVLQETLKAHFEQLDIWIRHI